ncbi:MAG TPA: cytochrome P460 family protein [Acidobacteriaceae bacterium]|jgi:hypothetical protein|nr:cytochrome P460 family protein [Acidobacteriaceae bacterium]
MKTVGKLVIAGVAALALLQFVHPGIPAKPATAELQAPPEVRHILENDCYSCHSDQRRLSWFDQVEPAYWLVRRDVLTAREHLDFSTLGSKPASARKAALYEAVNMVQMGAMPPPRFLVLHPRAEVTREDLATVKAYLAPWTPAPKLPGNAAAPASTLPPIVLAGVRPELNGLPFDPAFESWKPISTTDRGDNNTFRFVLGNDIAVKAARSGNISPWPGGSRFAKVAWQQTLGPDGLLHPGNFVQVELMVKDAHGYRNTEGWGWGRWRGLDLQPYGKDARFVNECTGCHMPLRGNDHVYTLPITSAHVAGKEVVNNAAAALPASLPWQPLGWSAITLYVDPKNHTTATLYGNDAAIEAVRGRDRAPTGAPAPAYTAGAVVALVTWSQRDDPHWFGARIPDVPRSVEFVQVEGKANSYRRYAGPGLAEDRVEASTAAQRTTFLLTLAPARLP